MKIRKIFLLLIFSIFITGCGNKVAFKVQEPLENAALVYIYVTEDLGTPENSGGSDYIIRINNKRYLQRVRSGEFIALNLKPQLMKISATRAQIEEKVLNMELKRGYIYYLKISDNLEGGKFDFEIMSKAQALKEISKTGLAGSSVESRENIITELITGTKSPKEEITPKRQVLKTKPSAKMDEIQKAYKLKEEGILSDTEFQTLKTEILSK